MNFKEKWTNLIYVAGPYRASCEYLVKQNIRKAEDVGIELWSWGWVPVIPHMNTAFFGGAYGLSDDVWLKGDLAIIKKCDLMVVLPGWQFSSGTKHEITVATEAGIPVYYWENEKDRFFLRYFYLEFD
jgi:hypothetical protein